MQPGVLSLHTIKRRFKKKKIGGRTRRQAALINNDEPRSSGRIISRGTAALQSPGGSGCVYPRVCAFVCVCVRGTGGPRPRGEPASPARRGGERPGSTNLRPAPAAARTSCGAARAGKGSHPLRLQNKSSGACAGALLLGRRLAHRTTCAFLARKVFVLRVFVVLPAFVLRPPPCSAERGRS